MKFDVITFGSAIEDNFLRLESKDYKIMKGRPDGGKNLCFSLGSKFLIEEMDTASGGGGTNAAATFSRQGFKTAYCGKVGKDERGERIVKELKSRGIDVSFVKKDKRVSTAYSIILSSSEEERTILIHPGACHYLKKSEIPWQKIKKTKWFYLAPLSGETAKVFSDLTAFARKNGIRVAANLGFSQLNLRRVVLRSALNNLDVLILNKEETEILAKEKNELEIIRRIRGLTKALVAVTKGKEGCLIFDKENIFSAKALQVKVVEKTGAGDAFGAGFVSGLLRGNDLEFAVQLAVANAAGCIREVGAKNGLLKRADKFKKVKISRISHKTKYA